MKKTNKLPLQTLGPKSENRPFFKEIIDMVVNDFVYWKRNFHPKDPAVLTYSETRNTLNNDFKEEFTTELYNLLAELKLDPPFFSPRYMAHMISECTLPSVIAYFATLLYNPNNISSEASPVTLEYELQVGKDFAKLFGFDEEKAFGHITSGGTVANYQSLYYNKNLRLIPLTMALFLKKQRLDLPPSLNKSVWELCNIEYKNYDVVISEFNAVLAEYKVSHELFHKVTMGELGELDYREEIESVFGEKLPRFKVITPSTAHYSWSRSANLFGIGKQSFIKVDLDKNYQVCVESMRDIFTSCHKNKHIILQTVAVYGTTEFSSFDPISKIVDLAKEFKGKGLYSPIHVDAAYGGYFSSFFHPYDEEIEADYYHDLYSKHQGIKDCDSITVDPHKLGQTPYGAGAFIFKYGYLKDFIAEEAAYCFSPKTTDSEATIQLGQYILEGSKPGASAAAVYFSHKLLPLETKSKGQHLMNLCDTALELYEILLVSNASSNDFKLIPITKPQGNILNFFIISNDTKLISDLNDLTGKIAARFGVRDVTSIQEYDYLVSNTTIDLRMSDYSEVKELQDLSKDTEELNLIRMVFMNQHHCYKNAKGETYIQGFLSELHKELNSSP